MHFVSSELIGLFAEYTTFVAYNAGGIANEVTERTEGLDALGNTTAATGKWFCVGSAVLATLALFHIAKPSIITEWVAMAEINSDGIGGVALVNINKILIAQNINCKLCINIIQNVVHDNIQPKTVVQKLIITDIFEMIKRKSIKTTFKQIRLFLSEYHKLSIQNAYKIISKQNIINLKLFVMNDINKLNNIINQIDSNYHNNIKEKKRDTKQIEFKLSQQYYNENKSDDHESHIKYNKLLNKYFNNQNIINEWWKYINDILNLISIVLWKGKIFPLMESIIKGQNILNKYKQTLIKIRKMCIGMWWTCI